MLKALDGLTWLSRMLVGSLFVVSGLIKANDALGFMYKLEEYFEPGAMNLEFLTPWALELAVFVCIAEVLLGIAILMGALPRLTAVLTMVMMVFFTWLTWYTATCDPQGTKEIVDATGATIEIPNQCVLECGCFGNAIPLTASEFLKGCGLAGICDSDFYFGLFGAHSAEYSETRQCHVCERHACHIGIWANHVGLDLPCIVPRTESVGSRSRETLVAPQAEGVGHGIGRVGGVRIVPTTPWPIYR